MTPFSRVTQKSLLHFGVRLLLCNSASVFYSEATIVDILLSEISYNMRIVTEMLGYNPLCLGERQRERKGKKREVRRRRKGGCDRNTSEEQRESLSAHNV